MLTRLVCLLGVLALAGCFQVRTDQEEIPGETETAPAGPKASRDSAVKPLNLGDIEATVKITGSLSPAEARPGIQVNTMETLGNKVTMVTLDVAPPHPDSLFLTFTIENKTDFRHRPVVLRGPVKRDGQPIMDVATVILKPDYMRGKEDASLEWPREFSVDVLQGLDAPVDTMLVMLEFEVHFMPKGTEAAVIDPTRAEAPPAERTKIFSNPVRVNFVAPEGGA